MKTNLIFERGHVNHEPVLHIATHRALVGLVDVVHRDGLNITRDVLLATEVQHLLGLLDATNQRPGDGCTLADQRGLTDGDRHWG